MAKNSITQIFQEMADLMEILGENPFKIRAYRNASRTLEGVIDQLEQLVEGQGLRELPGIGEAIFNKVKEFLDTGEVSFYTELKAKVPQGLLDMLKIKGMGPRKVKAVWKELGISTVGDLEYACQENRLVNLEGFGPRSQKKISEGISYLKKSKGRFLYSVAIRSAEIMLKELKKHPAVQRVDIAGSLRRRKEIIKDLDIVVSTQKPKGVMKFFTQMKDIQEVVAHGSTKSVGILENGLSVDLRTVTDKQFPYALHHSTGSKEHNTALRSRAKKKGYKMNEYGLFKGSCLVACRDEKEIFSKLGLAYIPPEMREDLGEIAAAEEGKLPQLVQEKDVRGVFHVHTTYSDGLASLEAMVQQAQKLGYEYIGISDHSQSAVYAHGLKLDRIQKQHQEIDTLNKKLKKIRILKGTECDILKDGKMDFTDRVLSTFDFVIASVHSQFNLSKSEMTKRVVRALKNKYVNMLGHSTGRLLLAREGYPIDLDEVIRVAVAEGKVIEINANPYRLDLDWRWLKQAKEKGLKVSINPDAHSLDGLSDTGFGVGIARKGWLEKKDVINTLSCNKVQAFLKAQRNG